MSDQIDPRTIPHPREFPTIRRFLGFYKITAWITGILLLLLVSLVYQSPRPRDRQQVRV